MTDPLAPDGGAMADIPDLGFRATIGAALHARAATDPNHEFVVTTDRRVTYAEIERLSANMARHMLARGIGKGTRVALYYSYSIEWIVFWLAASRIGALAMPLSTLYTPRELSIVLRAGDVHLLITSATVVGKDMRSAMEAALPELAGASGTDLRLIEVPYLREVWFSGAGVDAPSWAYPVRVESEPSEADVSVQLLEQAESCVQPGDLAVVVYTSGSSAEPKGVVHTHGTILRSSALQPDRIARVSPGLPPKVVCGMPFFWVGGILSLATALVSPMTLILMEKFDVQLALELIERERATYVSAWPTLIQRMRTHPDFQKRDLSSAPSLVSGPTDSAVIDAPVPGVPAHRGMSETMGTFVGVEAKVIDPRTGALVPECDDGELCVRGYGVMAGFYNRDSVEVFDEDGWYHTGDRVFRVAGHARLYYRGRSTDMIKSSGANVSPREVEIVLEDLPEIDQCFVFGTINDKRQEEVTAVVVPSPEALYVQADVAEKARRTLSAYKVPTRWVVIDGQRVPWLASGKADKRTLRALVESGQLS